MIDITSKNPESGTARCKGTPDFFRRCSSWAVKDTWIEQMSLVHNHWCFALSKKKSQTQLYDRLASLTWNATYRIFIRECHWGQHLGKGDRRKQDWAKRSGYRAVLTTASVDPKACLSTKMVHHSCLCWAGKAELLCCHLNQSLDGCCPRKGMTLDKVALQLMSSLMDQELKAVGR